MQHSIVLSLALAAFPYLAYAGQCRAVHYLTSNTAGGGVGGGGVTANNGINVYGVDNATIGTYVPSETDNPICQHTINIDLNPPYGPYSGTTKCGTLTIGSCSGSYVSETDIPGAVNNDDDYYGIGVTTSSECQVLFDC